MRRALFALASGLTAVAMAGALVNDYGSHASLPVVEPGLAVTEQSERPTHAHDDAPSGDAVQADSQAATNGGVARDQQHSNSTNDPRGTARRRVERDEATARADIRKRATENVQDSYSLLLEDLILTREEQDTLVALLIEMQIEGVWTRGSTWEIRGREIPHQERYERIAAVIGDQKLLEFLELQQNHQAYWETTQIARLLRRRGIPLTETQRDGVFEILVEVGDRYPHTPPPADVDNDSVEWIEHVLMQYDEHDRHVIELAPSVLTQDQVVRLFAQYQRMSHERIASVERAKKLKAEQPGKFPGWFFTPGSWH